MTVIRPILLLSCLITFLVKEGNSQADSLRPDSVIHHPANPDNHDFIYNDNIRTAKLLVPGSVYHEPVVAIKSGIKLELSFDDLTDEYREYKYSIVHCDRNWHVTDENMTNFYEYQGNYFLENYEYSSATKTDFVHYSLQLPAEGAKFLKSGNFLVRIFESKSDSLVLCKRFMIIDPSISATGKVTRTNDVKYSDYRQQIQLEVYDLKDAVEDISRLFVRVSKNASWEITCEGMRPSFVNNDRIYFERPDECVFEGGNEFRLFNVLEYRNISNNIVKVDISGYGMKHCWLDTDKPRSYLRYSTSVDHNGKSLYQGDKTSFKENELDYVMMYFSLKSEEIYLDREIYLYGELTGFRLDEKYKMSYDASREFYSLSIPLKQGLYNYAYIVKSIYEEGPDESMIEGSDFETENEFTIYIYYSDPLEGYDRLLAVDRINSRQKIE